VTAASEPGAGKCIITLSTNAVVDITNAERKGIAPGLCTLLVGMAVEVKGHVVEGKMIADKITAEKFELKGTVTAANEPEAGGCLITLSTGAVVDITHAEREGINPNLCTGLVSYKVEVKGFLVDGKLIANIIKAED
jgi:predicted transcriptional regulator